MIIGHTMMLNILAFMLGCSIVAIGLLLIFFGAVFYQRKVRANCDPAKLAEMERITLAWARLAPVPIDAKRYSFRPESSVSRRFRMRFTANPVSLHRWIAVSSGLHTAIASPQAEGAVYYIIKPAEDVAWAEATIMPMTGQVEIYVSWS